MIEELEIDLFEYIKDVRFQYCIVHCISNDWKLGKGFALSLNDRYRVTYYRNENFPNIATNVGDAILYNINDTLICNLITKTNYWSKPNYEDLNKCLKSLRSKLSKNTVLVMPRIGCGLDKLSWNNVKRHLELVLPEYRIKVCDLPRSGIWTY